MKIKSVWINIKKKRKMMSPIDFREYDVFDAQSVEQPGLTGFINIKLYKQAIEAMESGSLERVKETLELLKL